MQETHGALEDLLVAFPELFRSFHIFASCCDSAAAGGLLTFVAKKRCRSGAHTLHSDVDGGRAMRLEPADGEARVVLWNIHSFGLVRHGLDQIRASLGSDLDVARGGPMQFSVAAVGDFNFLASGGTVFRLEAPSGAPAQTDRADRPGQAVLSALASRTVDITDGVHTHFALLRTRSAGSIESLSCSLLGS